MKRINRLKAWRLSRGLTQAQMADFLGVAEFTYIRYENFAKKTLSIEMLEKILHATSGDITPNDLIGLSKDELKTLKSKGSSLKCIEIDQSSDVLNHHYNLKHQPLVKEFLSSGKSV